MTTVLMTATLKDRLDNGTQLTREGKLVETAKSLYQVNHQVELLHLHAETEVLFQQLQQIKQKRQVAVGAARS